MKTRLTFVKAKKDGKKYTFKIRAFTKVKKLKNGKLKTVKQYGKWSNVIKIIAKK